MRRASPQFRDAALKEMGLAPVWTRRAPKAPAAAPLSFEQVPVAAVALQAAVTPQADSVLARDQVIRALAWPDLIASVSACRACPLCEARRQAVFGVGVERPEWLFVGEAPGAEEDERGEPFVGEAGRLLDNMLKAIGLTRPEKLYIANVMKCRPPRNRNPEPLEVDRCTPYLMRQIELLRPRIIVTLGRFASEAVLATHATVGSLRGRVHRLALGELTIPVIVTYHPAYLLRNLGEKRLAWNDLCLARSTLEASATA